MELVGDAMVESERDGHQVFTAAAIADPYTWEVQVAARDDSKLLERMIDLGDEEVRVLGWPDDPEWADFAETQVSDGVPVLEDLIGLAWPAERTLDVVETSSPYLYGYAGWYQPWSELIEVGDELDGHVMLHELAHLWFNDDLFSGRWINEALAEVYAAAAVDEMGGEARTPDAVRADDPGRLRLNQWGEPDLQSGDTDAQEQYGYNASWSVLQGIVDEIGVDGLAAVVQAADEHQMPYSAETVDSVLTQFPVIGEQMYATIGVTREDKAGRLAQFAKNDEFFGAPAALFCFIDRRMGPPQWSDLGMYLQTFMLLAQEAGLDTCPQEYWTVRHAAVQAFVGAPAEEMLFCGVAIGHADPEAPINALVSERMPLEEWARFL